MGASIKDLLCALSLIFHLLVSTAPVAAAVKQEDCSPNSCGKVNISYPFWLTGQHPPECGYPSFNVTCNSTSERASLNFFGHNYHVKNIFYGNQSLLLSAAEFVEDPCRLPYYNLTYDDYPLTISASNKQIIFFLNCTTPLPSDYKEVTCARSGRPAFYGGEYDASSDQPSFAGCVPAVVPVVGYSNTSRDANYTVPLSDGWLMNWTVKDCKECHDSGGTCGYESSTASFICVCSDRIHRGSCKQNSSRKTITIITIGLSAALVSLSLLCLYRYRFICFRPHRRSHRKHMMKVEAFLNEHASLKPKRYKYSEIKKMTRSFSNKLGLGGYGTVYKGSLPDGHLVAVKLLSDDSSGDGEEFINEVASISKTSHVNIVNLVGFCIEGSKKALIYDLMPNGSLDKFISSSDQEETKNSGPSLDWEQLHQIAVGIARGLEYLHRGCNTRIVHFDIKPHNILLDQDFCPKISDFGLAKSGRPKDSKISMTGARGTIGYIAPEVFSRNIGAVSSKLDVYSYGMMVLEMVGAKRSTGTAKTLKYPYPVRTGYGYTYGTYGYASLVLKQSLQITKMKEERSQRKNSKKNEVRKVREVIKGSAIQKRGKLDETRGVESTSLPKKKKGTKGLEN